MLTLQHFPNWRQKTMQAGTGIVIHVQWKTGVDLDNDIFQPK